jgi:Regulator of ribonuclease activity B
MTWYLIALLAALAVVGARMFVKLRAAASHRAEGWDERQIAQLRSAGYAPFRDYPVDFFLALPDELACQSVRARLEPEFAVDVKALQEDREFRFSLHATKNMHLIVPEMQDVRRRLTALALEFKGRYDGWAA